MPSLDELRDPNLSVPTDTDVSVDAFPRLWWRYGTPPGQAGFFYTPASAWTGDLPEPWAEAEVFAGERGWVSRSVEICVIARRSQPYRKEWLGDRTWRVYADRWEPGMHIHTEVLALLRGVEETPIVWSYHGATGAVVNHRKDGVWAVAHRLLAQEATRVFKRPIGLSAFWVPLGPTLDARGKPVFVRLPQGAQLNHVTLRLPDLVGERLLADRYVGRDVLERVTALRDEHAAWAQRRRGVLVPATPEPAPAPAPTNGNLDAYDEDAPF